jgi:hypothetical protein
MRELVESVGGELCGDKRVSDLGLVYTFAANMDSLVRRGIVQEDVSGSPARYLFVRGG